MTNCRFETVPRSPGGLWEGTSLSYLSLSGPPALTGWGLTQVRGTCDVLSQVDRWTEGYIVDSWRDGWTATLVDRWTDRQT